MAVLNRIEESIKYAFSTENVVTQKNGALLHIYVTKALVLRGHSNMYHWLDKVFSQFSILIWCVCVF